MASPAPLADKEPKLPVEELHFQLVVKYVSLMKELRLRFQSVNDKPNKTKIEADTKAAYTRNLLAKIQRPADLYPLCRLLFPQVCPLFRAVPLPKHVCLPIQHDGTHICNHSRGHHRF